MDDSFDETEVREDFVRQLESQRREIRSLHRQLRVYQQLDDDAASVKTSYPADHPYGYVVAVCAFISQFFVLGSINTYSVFNSSMMGDKEWGAPGYTKVATVVAVANFLSTLVGAVVGHISDVHGPKPLFVMAGLFLFIGEYFGSQTSNFWEFALLYSLMVGTSAGFIISPGMGAVSGWFDKKRGLAIGIASAGSGAGSATIPVFASAVYKWCNNDWRPSFVWISLLAAPVTLVGFVVRHRVKAKRFNTAQRSAKQLIRSRPFTTLWIVGVFFGYGFFTAVYNFVPYAIAQGKGPYIYYPRIPIEQATSLMTVFGLMQCVGNVVCGIITDRYGSGGVFAVSHVISGLLLVGLPHVHSYVWLLVLCGGFGFTAAGCITCYPHIAAGFYTGPQLSSALALLYTGFGLGGLLGPPLTEELITLFGEDFRVGLGVAGGSFIVAAFLGLLFMPTPFENKESPLLGRSGSYPSIQSTASVEEAPINDAQHGERPIFSGTPD